MQLNVVNLGDGSVTPDPCVATLSFLDANGRDLADPIVLTLSIGGGSGFAELLSTHGIIINDKIGRAEVRGLVSFPIVPDPSIPNACTDIQAGMEVVNAKTGQTTVFYEGPDT